MSVLKKVAAIAGSALAILAITLVAALTWLHAESSRPLDDWFHERHGTLAQVDVEAGLTADGQRTLLVSALSDSGLAVRFRVIRPGGGEPQPVLIVLGGHRTGSRAAELLGNVGAKAVVALDYPYDGPSKLRGVPAFLRHLPAMRRAFRDTPAAVFLVLDWLAAQSWADMDRVLMAGVSLGVPFAAAAAARDPRIGGLILVHGAADNQLWFELNVAQRLETRVLQRPVATILNWLAYGPAYDTPGNVGRLSPRPVLVVGALEDERTPAGQTQILYDAASEPRRLRWTRGRHVQPGRPEIVADILSIADEEFAFLIPGEPPVR